MRPGPGRPYDGGMALLLLICLTLACLPIDWPAPRFGLDLSADAARAVGTATLRRATYVFVVRSSLILIRVIVCIARFSWRSPPR